MMNLLKYFFHFCVFALLFVCCKNEQKSTEGQVSDGQAATIEQNKRDVPKNGPTNSTLDVEETPVAAKSESPMPTVNGSNVTMREAATVQSAKVGSFENGEKVEVLESKNVDNEGEAILTKPITVKGSGGEVNLPKGKAVVIGEYLSDENRYRVTYEDPQKGKLTAEVDAAAVETITYSTWYRVKRSNGETGWVLGKFLKIN
jgi:hypothetical protein